MIEIVDNSNIKICCAIYCDFSFVWNARPFRFKSLKMEVAVVHRDVGPGRRLHEYVLV